MISKNLYMALMKHLFILISLFLVLPIASASPILDQIRDHVAQLKSGIIIMDLDETVIDTHGRKYLSYFEAHQVLCDKGLNTSEECEKALGLSLIDFYRLDNGYSWQQLMSRLQLPNSDFVGTFNKKMVEFYLSGKWMETDTPMPGANSYVRELKRLGAQVFFVSSRYSDIQSLSTHEQLTRLGFIQNNNFSNIILRSRGEDSLTFKKAAVQKIAQYAKLQDIPVIGLFENEPENLNAWKKAFPDATAVLIKGNILIPTELSSGITIVEDYR